VVVLRPNLSLLQPLVTGVHTYTVVLKGSGWTWRLVTWRNKNSGGHHRLIGRFPISTIIIMLQTEFVEFLVTLAIALFVCGLFWALQKSTFAEQQKPGVFTGATGPALGPPMNPIVGLDPLMYQAGGIFPIQLPPGIHMGNIKPPPPILVNNVYQIVYQRYNKLLGIWQAFDPLATNPAVQEGIIFVVYHRYESEVSLGHVKTLVEIRSESLKKVLKTRLKSIEFVDPGHPAVPTYMPIPMPPAMPPNPQSFDSNPQVLYFLYFTYCRLMRGNCALLKTS
jgi:hypothetical protein